MLPLRIQLFGGLRLYRGPDLLPPPPDDASKAELAFLVLNQGSGPAVGALLDPRDGDAPSAAGDDAGAYWLDVHAFEAALDRAGPDDGAPLTDEQAAHVRAAVALYRGDLLEGTYDDWCLFERERLRLRYLAALERLMRHHQARGEWVHAAFCARGLLSHDALREHVHRALMRCLARLGDAAAALRQFDRCAGLLRRELQVEPAPETLALRDEIRAFLPRPAPDAGLLHLAHPVLEDAASCQAG